MKKYDVRITTEALEALNQYLSYLLFVKKSKTAYNNVLDDYYETVGDLANMA